MSKNVVRSIRIPKELDDKIIHLSAKRLCTVNAWITRVLTNASRINKEGGNNND